MMTMLADLPSEPVDFDRTRLLFWMDEMLVVDVKRLEQRPHGSRTMS